METYKYVDNDTKDIYEESTLRSKLYNVVLSDAGANEVDIFATKGITLQSLYNYISIAINGSVLSVIEVLNDNYGYNIEVWKRISLEEVQENE